MTISGATLTELMIYCGWLAVFLLVGKLIRARLVFVQKLFLPASIIGGFLGLALGPYVLGKTGIQVLPQEMLDLLGAPLRMRLALSQYQREHRLARLMRATTGASR